MQYENLSQWFSLDEQKPWEPGVYEVQYHYGQIGCAYFNGKEFAYGWVIGSREENMQSALRSANRLDCYQPISWRGLSSDPSAKPKARGNRRVTRYVVISASVVDRWKEPLAVFSSLKNVRLYAEACDMPLRVKKIRFRTPEAS